MSTQRVTSQTHLRPEKCRRPTAWLVSIALLAMVLCAGCTTTDSDLPWATPQPWEGHPAIPGFSTD